MIKDLLKGVSMGAGMGVGSELTGSIIQGIRNRRGGGAAPEEAAPPAAAPVVVGSALERDIQCGQCRTVNTGDSKFCGECGFSLMSRITLASGIKCLCGFINCSGQKFCSECGKKLETCPEVIKCNGCGEDVEVGRKFCSGCGNQMVR